MLTVHWLNGIRRISCAMFFVLVADVSLLPVTTRAENALGRDSQTASEAAQSEAFATSNKPFNSFSALAAGAVTIAAGACSGLTCNSSDACNCFSMSSVPLKVSGLGESTLSCALNNDVTRFANNGSNGVNEPASGVCTITAASGDKLNLELSGWLGAVDGSSFIEISEGFTITGGTGKLPDAAGTGTFTLSIDSIAFGTANGVVSLSGAFRK
jgi:hypothetical protein